MDDTKSILFDDSKDFKIMNNIPTAEELLRAYFHYETDETFKEKFKFPDKEQILAFGKEMARLHSEAALKAASEKAEIKTNTYGHPDPSEWTKYIDKNSILNAYPKKLIQ